jgi:CheY-like chemotaxis protein
MKGNKITVLLVDDDPSDQDFIARALKMNAFVAAVNVVNNGEEAIAYLEGEGKCSDRAQFKYPSAIIMDLKMYPGDGFSVLQYLKSKPQWAIIPTVILSGSEDRDDIKKSYILGASAYLVKPGPYEELVKLIETLCNFWMVCEIPEVDETGKRVLTNGSGKLGERIPQ